MTNELDPRPDAASPAADDATTSMSTPVQPLAPPVAAVPGMPVHEKDVTWATAEPVVPVASPPKRGGRLRWAAAIAVVAVVLGATAAVAALVTGSSASSAVIGYVPADATMYGELRLDLPGDQRQAVGAFLQKFPGFADQASLDTKLDEVLDDLVRDATDGDQTYTADIKPWFGGEIGYSVGALPPVSDLKGSTLPAAGQGSVIVALTDAAKADAWISAEIASTGAKTTTDTYQGTTITILDKTGGVEVGYAIVDQTVAVFGDLKSVKAAIDSKGHSDFASQPGPKAALASVEGDYVAFGYVAIRPLLDWSMDASQQAAAGAATAVSSTMSATVAKLIPDWTAFWLRFENDALVVQGSAPRPEVAIGPTKNHPSAAIEHVPGDAVVAVTSNDVGATIQQLVTLLGSDPAAGSMVDGLDNALGIVGGSDAALGWIGDVAIAAQVDGDNVQGGVVIVPTDVDAAQKLVTSLKTLISLGGSQAGVSISEETYNGATITTVDLSKVDALSATGLPADAAIKVSFSAADGIVVVGSGPKFVKAVLDTTSSTSLAADPTWSRLSGQAGPSTSTTFVDISAIRGLIEAAVTTAAPSAGGDYDSSIKPFITPFDALFAAGSVDGDLTRSDLIIAVH